MRPYETGFDAGPGFLGWIIRPIIESQKESLLEKARVSAGPETHSGLKSLEDRVNEAGGRPARGARASSGAGAPRT